MNACFHISTVTCDGCRPRGNSVAENLQRSIGITTPDPTSENIKSDELDLIFARWNMLGATQLIETVRDHINTIKLESKPKEHTVDKLIELVRTYVNTIETEAFERGRRGEAAWWYKNHKNQKFIDAGMLERRYEALQQQLNNNKEKS